MADKHPYVNSPGNLEKTIKHLRKSFPTQFTANTLKKLGIARNNESYILNVLRFIKLIDDDGNKTDEATQIFSIHDDKQFAEQFSKQVKNFYSDLFELHRDSTWTLNKDTLIQFFRTTDQTTGTVGKLQASTFLVLSGFAGHGEAPTLKSHSSNMERPKRKSRQKDPANSKAANIEPSPSAPLSVEDKESRNFGLTVRIEINLPADGNKETYDNIFRSIRENLLND